MTGRAGKRARGAVATGEIVATLDIGSHKICCLIGMLEPDYAASGEIRRQLRVLGVGHQRSQGIAGGAVVDLRLAQAAVSAAVSQAEHAAGVRIERVVLAVGSGEPRSRTFDGQVELLEGVVREVDLARLDGGARAFAIRDGAALVSLNRISYRLDSTNAVSAPIGLAGQRLAANHHAVTTAPGPLRNLCMLVESCHLELAGLLPSSFASAIAATTESERRSGVVCVDIGANLTSIAGFADGHFIFAGSVPIGGQQLTEDLARVSGLPLAEAERIKTLYSSLAQSAFDEHDRVPLSGASDGASGSPGMTRADVGRAVAGAMHGLLQRVRGSVDGCSIARIRNSGVVLTGGGSELLGLDAFASVLLPAIRVSAPPRLEGAGVRSSNVSSPAFACVVGAALSVALPSQWIATREPAGPARQGYLGRVERWLKESF